MTDSEAIRAWRVIAGLTQMDAATRLGVHVATWQRWELGRARPKGLARKALIKLGALDK